MKLSPLNKLFLLLLSVVVLSACSGGQATVSWPGLTTDGNTAYMAFNQFVYAIDLSTGQQLWRFPAEKAESNLSFYAPPVLVSDNQLLVGSFAQSRAKPFV
jgi:outer membrane protein assembly factor BamB